MLHAETHGDERSTGAGGTTRDVAVGVSRNLRAPSSRVDEPPGLGDEEVDFSSQSSEDDMRRRKGNVRAIVLNEIPLAFGFRTVCM